MVNIKEKFLKENKRNRMKKNEVLRGKCPIFKENKRLKMKREYAELSGGGLGNNPMVGCTVAVAVSIQEAAEAGKF